MADKFDEIARKIISDWGRTGSERQDAIATALRMAVEEERDECANAALNTEVFPMPKNRIVVQTTRQIINRAIRSRSKP